MSATVTRGRRAARRQAEADRGSVAPEEVGKFARLGESWWDPAGDMRPLHALNPVRIAWLRDHLAAHFGGDPESMTPLAGLRIVDIGCGGGLLAEPMARLGARVTGLDAAPENIEVARRHAEAAGLDIDYRCLTAEALARRGERFDAVLAMEIVEHVASPARFLRACAALVRPGSALGLSTLNRTAKAFLLGVVGAEYVLGWLPRGSHDWRKFLRPSEVAAMLRRHGVETREVTGVAYDPLAGAWHPSHGLDVNYMIFAAKP